MKVIALDWMDLENSFHPSLHFRLMMSVGDFCSDEQRSGNLEAGPKGITAAW